MGFENPADSADSRTMSHLSHNATHDQVTFVLDQTISILSDAYGYLPRYYYDDILPHPTPFSKSPELAWIKASFPIESIFFLS